MFKLRDRALQQNVMKPLVVFTALALLFISGARAELVYGNLGADGTTALGSVNNDIGPGSGWLAQGFNTGTSSLLSLQSVTLGLFGANVGTIPLTVSIFSGILSGTNNIVPDVSLYTSAAVNVGDKNKYSFTFSNAQLQANTTYFVVPNGGSWYYNSGTPAAPLSQNGSGYVNAGTWEITSTNAITPAGTWEVAESSRYSLSVYATSNAVPEPGTWAAAALLAGGAAFVRWRKGAKVS
ncbi:MAG: PEP-CTERM sorting domain-containing protein [Chthoniobacterales bacterium]|nr:PEP-CTERM sorting domain-containing protein [Chthoniobacterales bacterium]